MIDYQPIQPNGTQLVIKKTEPLQFNSFKHKIL